MTASSSRLANDISDGRGARAPSLLKSLLYAACIVVPVTLVIAITSSKPDAFAAPVGEPRAATATEQRAILIAVIEHQRSSERSPTFDANGAQRRLALENVTVSICAKPRQILEGCSNLASRSAEYLKDSRSQSNPLIDALPRFSGGQRPLDARAVPGIVPVDREHIAAIFETKSSWPAFRRAYPQADGILRVSRPVVSARGDQALLYVETRFLNKGMNSELELFALQQGQWKFVGLVGLGESWSH